MKIIKFIGKNLYGYLDVSPDFRKNLTFLTGINGSGKTSVVRGISSLLSPSLVTLSNIHHERMDLIIKHDKHEITIWSESNDSHLILGTSETTKTLKINIFPEDEDKYSTINLKRRIIEYYEDQETRNSDHEVLKLIKSLPTPMILGIDRRSQELIDTGRITTRTIRLRRRRENIFRTSLSASLEEAIYLAERKYRLVESKRSDLDDKLREKIILGALKYEETPKGKSLKIRKEFYTYNFKQRKEDAINTLFHLGIPQEYVSEQLNPFFNKLTELIKKIPMDFDYEKFDFENNPDMMKVFLEWMMNRPQFERIVNILELVDKHITQVQELRLPIQRYLDGINSFFQDANKQISFNDSGELCVIIKQKSLEPLTSLSSGECQLIVILTHLSFNPVAKSANVFIVDEPELSLHIKWQESFVSAIQKANPELQLILATHSPSIVLDRTQYCFDLSKVTK